ncbi:MAG TPA: hypothetical protein VEC75_02285 [Stellaceae bacterium]|nr:hypothetical protein [Stellaceae bacterium]
MQARSRLCGGIGAAAFLFALVPLVAEAQGTSIPAGKYECWNGSSARMAYNFASTGPGRYTDTEGKAGTYEIAAGGKNVTFHGGALDGQKAIYSPGNPPTVTILGPSGGAVGDCQLVR